MARETNPMENLVCTIGVIKGGDRYNVGCGDVYLEGTCRTYEPAKRDYIERRLGESLQALDMLLKTESTLDYKTWSWCYYQQSRRHRLCHIYCREISW